jgi:microcystin-dependent protein
MKMNLGFGNNIRATLAADINSLQTVFSVMPGTGALFARTLQEDASLSNPSYSKTIYSKITITDALETVFEICHLISVTGDSLTVIRGQEGTTRKGWSLNDVVSNFSTRGSENNFVQIEDLQNGKYLSAIAGGTANALTITLPSTFFINGGNTFALRSSLYIKPILSNTGAATIQLIVSDRIIGTYPLYKGVNSNLEAGDLNINQPAIIVFSQELACFFMVNPAKGLFDSARFLEKSNNLSDLTDKDEARKNLGIELCPHKVGDVIFRGNNNNPATDYPGTTWQDLNTSYNSRSIMIGSIPLTTGGTDDVTLSVTQLPNHGHTFSGSTGGGGAHAHGLRSYSSNTALEGGTSNRQSIDVTTNFNTTSDLISAVSDHTHSVTGTIGSTGGGQSFSVISRYLQVRAWMRTA